MPVFSHFPDHFLVVLGSLGDLVDVVVQDLRLGLLKTDPLAKQQLLLFMSSGTSFPRLQAGNLVELVEKAIAAMGVVVAV